MEIYFTDVNEWSEEDAYQSMLPFVPEARRERLSRCRSAADRARGLGAGLLLEYGLRKRGITLLQETAGYETAELKNGPYGKPCLQGGYGICFNLSHAGEYAAAVFAEHEAGIDIERIRTAKQGLADRFFTEAEAAYVRRCADRGEGDLAFTRIWTRKESCIKAAGEGMRLPLDSFDVLCDELTLPGKCAEGGVHAGAGYGFYTVRQPEGYVLSVCAERTDREDIVLRPVTCGAIREYLEGGG